MKSPLFLSLALLIAATAIPASQAQGYDTSGIMSTNYDMGYISPNLGQANNSPGSQRQCRAAAATRPVQRLETTVSLTSVRPHLVPSNSTTAIHCSTARYIHLVSNYH
jgi:hypothetical protein